MPMPGLWNKTLVYLGLAEDDEDIDEYAEEAVEEPQADRQTASRPAAVRRIPEPATATGGLQSPRPAVVRAMPQIPSAKFHLVNPGAFNDAQEVGDKFRDGFSVIMNLQAADVELARRLVDFASGLAYGLAGSMQPVADRVFLITPAGVEVSAEERRRFLEERGFYNQA